MGSFRKNGSYKTHCVTVNINLSDTLKLPTLLIILLTRLNAVNINIFFSHLKAVNNSGDLKLYLQSGIHPKLILHTGAPFQNRLKPFSVFTE